MFGQVDGLHSPTASLFPAADNLVLQSLNKLSVCTVILGRHNLASLYLNSPNFNLREVVSLPEGPGRLGGRGFLGAVGQDACRVCFIS
jgi:hypothetical protein